MTKTQTVQADTGDIHSFQAEVSRLLDIVANALYSDKEVFLRELISNASDACDRLRHEAIAKPELAGDDTNYRIWVRPDPATRTVVITDNGIGMSREELIENLGTIAKSGTGAALEQAKDSKDVLNAIGQFGVGFYSAFMVADKVTVRSKKAGEETAWLWESDGKGCFSVQECQKDARGTQITLHIKDDDSDFLLETRLRHIIEKYSDHIAFPILMGEGDNAPQVNSSSALWTRNPKEIADEKYREFYHHVGAGFDVPFKTLHWKAEGAIEYTCLLYIPSSRPFDLYDPKRAHSVKLYVKRVFITEGTDGLVPPYLRFLRGVVDSEDLPLNISREMLQHNPMVAKIASGLTKKILSELEKLAEDNPGEFEIFWNNFGSVLKEGLYEHHAHRAQLFKVVRFQSTQTDVLTTLEQYKERMQEGQKYIYILTGEDAEALKQSPQLEAFQAKGIEVLLMTDTIDEFWLPSAGDYKGIPFKSVTTADLGLDDDAADEESKDHKKDIPENIKTLIDCMKDILGDEVKDVRVSKRLTESPVCLVADDGDADLRVERLLRKSQGYDGKAKRILEINDKHSLIIRLADKESDDVLKDMSYLLLDQARIVEGEAVSDPAAFSRRLSRALEQGLV